MFSTLMKLKITIIAIALALGIFANAGRVSAAEPTIPTLFVVGDSTARNNANGARGWGDPFVDYFDATKMRVLNRAMAGRSSRTFITEGRWDKVVAEMKSGDYVLIQMGHNDGGAIEGGRGRASLPGIGDDTKEITTAAGSKETVQSYGWYLRKMISDAKAKGVTPMILSLTVRNIWKDGKIERGSGRFSEWAAEVAKSQGLAFIDVTNIIADRYQNMGQERVKEMFGPDYVHTSPAGADLNAASVVAGIKQLQIAPLVSALSDKGKVVAAATSSTVKSFAPLAVAPIAVASAGVLNSNLRTLPVPANPNLPSLYLIGDSTVRNGQGDGGNGQWGWGDFLAAHFDTTKINVVNRAVGGLSSRTYLTSGYWEQVQAMLKPGDFVMMQFGHNDAGAINDPSRARATLRGAGEESQAIDNLLTKKPEVVRTYGWYLRQFIQDAKAKGATPIVCSPVPRKNWRDGKIARSTESYPQWAATVAKGSGVAFIDLYEIIARQYDELGPEDVEPLFGDAHTHTSRAGAELNARAVVTGLKALGAHSLIGYLAAQAKQ